MMESYFIKNLTKQYLSDRIDDFILILQDVEEEYWDTKNFMLDLKGKWDLSICLLNETNQLLGYIIASEKEESVHIHKFMISTNHRNLGYGKVLLDYFEGRCKDIKKKIITLKVYVNNKKAIQFYKRNNFSEISCTSNLMLMAKII